MLSRSSPCHTSGRPRRAPRGRPPSICWCGGWHAGSTTPMPNHSVLRWPRSGRGTNSAGNGSTTRATTWHGRSTPHLMTRPRPRPRCWPCRSGCAKARVGSTKVWPLPWASCRRRVVFALRAVVSAARLRHSARLPCQRRHGNHGVAGDGLVAQLPLPGTRRADRPGADIQQRPGCRRRPIDPSRRPGAD